MCTPDKTTTDSSFDQIRHYFGFIPPVFAAVQSDNALLEGLWQQTRTTYINNPLPPEMKEKFFLYISYACNTPYDLRYHCILLNRYGINEHEILTLLQTPLPTTQEVDQHIQQLRTLSEPLDGWPTSDKKLELMFFTCIVHLFLHHSKASSHCRKEMQRLLGTHYMFLVALFNYVHTCQRWVETNPELHKEKDEQIGHRFKTAFGDETRLHAVLNTQFEQAHQQHQVLPAPQPLQEAPAVQKHVSPEIDQRMNDFLGITAHELKTPITTIKGTIQILLRTAKREIQKTNISVDEYMQTMDTIQHLLTRADNQVRRLTHLINDIVYISRIQDKKLDPRLERGDLTGLLKDVVNQQRQLNTRRTIQVEDSLLPAYVMMDRDHVEQVITNYLSNALKYSPENQQVEISLHNEDKVVKITVHDHGPGISKEDQGHIWERFYRVQHAEVLSGSGIGFGLGLYISRSIIEKHGGEVGVSSAVGQGTTFWFTLAKADQNLSGYKNLAGQP
ncbi:sensor histidine kinase [Dictyobacter kobayashii]|uniref:histidine kinase n=1 Tax=Dictyobacter kobayashii TaxID=2014872 RepID=A0A402ABE9_9CHLR|nr:HAMP domain-containing sensor histidine kinase [Dictyobacter kobayashii]GCE16421.1 hypothetical protein KDK_02210 [Dictyobacter kobayashii]